MANMVRWNLDVLRNIIQQLESERSNLETQRNQMQVQQERVDANWQSPAGRQYHSRLQADMANIANILTQLKRRIGSLRRVQTYYTNCEGEIRIALNKLPQ
jgi:uncharacterized protein YukE